ncbi:P450 86A1 [Seminavis robusta]|uniref:P450 86A1 n=1 Tax=Seminavis robusta TaxID=568900 RepID=A0A9N8HEP2_9STRA|nr:P450 86A1 [Seminavis robusta]|eukprot:Sro418_g138870.1 P450 86A1 (394) ;mRNA; r:26468-27807
MHFFASKNVSSPFLWTKPYQVQKGPFLGILLPLFKENRDRLTEALHNFSEKYQCTWGGPLPHIGAMSGSFFCTVEAKNIEHEMVFEVCLEWEMGSLWLTDQPTWYRHRKIASRMFSTNLLREGSKVTLKKVKELSALLNVASSTGQEVDFQDFFFRMTLDITCVLSFGLEYGSLQNKTQHPFTLAFNEMQQLLVERITDPLFELKRFFNVTKREKRIGELKVILDEHAKEIIQGRRRTAEDGKLGPDILSRFIDYATKHNEDVKRGNGVCGRIDGDNDGDYSFNTIQKLQYMDAIVMEVLRFHPSVPVTLKYAINDDVLPDGTFIPKGAMMALPPFDVGRSCQVWGSDAGEFKPTRFLNQKNQTASKYSTFHAGKSFCLGKPMALNTMKLTLA